MGPRPTPPLLSVDTGPPLVHARGGVSAGVVTALLVQTVISAGTYLVAKRALAEVPVSTLVLWRFLLSGAVFALLVLVLPGPALPPRRAMPAALALGFLAGPLNQGLFFAGLQRSTAAHASLLYALTPIGVYLYSVLRGREAPSARAGWACCSPSPVRWCCCSPTGCERSPACSSGDVLILGAVIAWVLYTAEGKAFIGEHGPLRATAWSMIAGALWLVPRRPGCCGWTSSSGASLVVKGAILYLALLASVGELPPLVLGAGPDRRLQGRGLQQPAAGGDRGGGVARARRAHRVGGRGRTASWSSPGSGSPARRVRSAPPRGLAPAAVRFDRRESDEQASLAYLPR